jgi:hypothetical protein
MKVQMGRVEDFDPDDPDIEFRNNRWEYWDILKKIRTEALANSPPIAGQLDFVEYMKDNYGIKLHTINGAISDKFDVVDEKLYIFFLLKWK